MNLLLMYFFPLFGYFFPYWSIYSPLRPVFRHPQSIFFPHGERRSYIPL